MTTRIIDILRSTPIYAEMLAQVPEDQREAAIAALEEQLQPYESLMLSLPSGAVENFMRSLNNDGAKQDEQPTPASTRRQPRRF